MASLEPPFATFQAVSTHNKRAIIFAMRTCFSQCSIAVKRHHGHSDSYKGKHLIGAGLQFGSLNHCHHGGEHSSMER